MDVHDNPSAAALGVFAETAAGSACGAPGVALDAALRRSRRSATANSSRRCCTPSSRWIRRGRRRCCGWPATPVTEATPSAGWGCCAGRGRPTAIWCSCSSGSARRPVSVWPQRALLVRVGPQVQGGPPQPRAVAARAAGCAAISEGRHRSARRTVRALYVDAAQARAQYGTMWMRSPRHSAIAWSATRCSSTAGRSRAGVAGRAGRVDRAVRRRARPRGPRRGGSPRRCGSRGGDPRAGRPHTPRQCARRGPRVRYVGSPPSACWNGRVGRDRRRPLPEQLYESSRRKPTFIVTW